MKKYFFLLLLMTSCYLPESAEGPISNTGPILSNGNNVSVSSNNLIGQTWKITNYRVGELGQMIATSDMLQFTTNTSYKFNGSISTYSFYVTGSGHNLTLNETPWGNLSGSILTNNLTSGNIPGISFTNIASGSSNTTKYYLWMIKL
ncbi:MAG: hypothetical protein KA210_00135 [Bacteroidia bacterium]|nr:hypothetical protein [Bacteroidia bacterium]